MKTIKQLAVFVAFISTISVPIKADILILQYGQIVTGKIVETNQDGVAIIKSKSGQVHYSASLIKDVLIEHDQPTTKRIPSWVNSISQLATNDWIDGLKQIPATVIDIGNLANVPYVSFRCNSDGYEINVYGDLDNPACIEIGAIGYNVTRAVARHNCLNFISSVLLDDADKEKVKSLNLATKELKANGDLTFETTFPDESDSYGGWWVSVYNDKALNHARASVEEMARITQPKVMPKVYAPVEPVGQVPQQSGYVATQNNYWSDTDISTYSRPSARQSSSGGSVYVSGYRKANGTYVNSYTRRSPSR